MYFFPVGENRKLGPFDFFRTGKNTISAPFFTLREKGPNLILEIPTGFNTLIKFYRRGFSFFDEYCIQFGKKTERGFRAAEYLTGKKLN